MKSTRIFIAQVLHKCIFYHHPMKHSMNTLFCDSNIRSSILGFYGGEMRTSEIYRRALVDERHRGIFQSRIRFRLNLCLYVPPMTRYPVTNLHDVTTHISSGGLEVVPAAIMKFSAVSSGM